MKKFENSKMYERFKTFLHYRRPLIAGFLNDIPVNSVILDFGCGPGNWSDYLENDLGFNVIGIDISKDSIYSANKNKSISGTKIDFVIGDVRALPFKNGSFSGLFSSDVLGHITDVDKAINEISRVLKKDAIAAVLTETNGYVGKNTYQDYVIKRVGEDPWIFMDGHIGLKSYTELRKIIANTDLIIDDKKFFPYNHIIFSLLYPPEYDYKNLTDKYPILIDSSYFKIIHLSALLRKKIFVCNAFSHLLLKILGTIFIYLDTNVDYGGIFFKLRKL